MPRLRVLAGPSLDDLTPIATNSGKPLDIKSDAFEGNLAVYIKGFADASGRVGDSPYFEKRKGVTWSIQMQGVFVIIVSVGELSYLHLDQVASCTSILRTTSSLAMCLSDR